jgi:hypothetical protein
MISHETSGFRFVFAGISVSAALIGISFNLRESGLAIQWFSDLGHGLLEISDELLSVILSRCLRKWLLDLGSQFQPVSGYPRV